jgi:biotin carboxyl carrier protein
MPKRVRLTEDGNEWVAEAATDGVRLSRVPEDPAGAPHPLATIRVEERGRDHFQVEDASGTRQAAGVLDADVAWVSIDQHVFQIRLSTSGRTAKSGARDHDALAPPMSATVVRIAVKPGDKVRQGDVLVSLEAMKMELPIRAPRDAVVTAIKCREGELVQPGVPVVELDNG